MKIFAKHAILPRFGIILTLLFIVYGHESGASASQQQGDQANASPAPSGQIPPTAAPTKVHAKDVKPPRLLHSVEPEYTDDAKTAKLSGVCVVSLVVNAQGVPEHVRVARSIGEGRDPKLKEAAAGLDQKAVTAVTQYRFSPAKYLGNPVPVSVSVSVYFRLP